jgi:hypothetical protein
MKIKLAKEHTHAGATYPAGAVLDLDGETVEWLRAQKVVEAPTLKAVQDRKDRE